MKDKLKQLGGLFITFAVVGVTTFGGGYAMLPALQREVVEKRRWATDEEVNFGGDARLLRNRPVHARHYRR